MALLAIGMFVFSIPTLAYDELQRKTEWRHARNPRIGARDAAQFVGPGDETVSLSGSVFSEIADGAASIDDLRTIADAGDPNPLVCATGRVYGSYVITGIDERESAWWPDGTPRRIDFAIDLLRVDDPQQAAG